MRIPATLWFAWLILVVQGGYLQAQELPYKGKTVRVLVGFPSGGVRSAVDMYAQQAPSAKGMEVERFLDASLIREMERNGFFASRPSGGWPTGIQ